MYIWNETRTHIQYEEEAGASSKQGTTDASGLREITYRPSIHSKSTTCLGGCTERRGSAVSKLLNLNSLWLCVSLFLYLPLLPPPPFSLLFSECAPPHSTLLLSTMKTKLFFSLSFSLCISLYLFNIYIFLLAYLFISDNEQLKLNR